QRCIFGRLNYNSVSAHQSRNNLPRGDRHGEIPRRYQAGHSDGLARAESGFVGELGLGREPVQASALPGDEVCHIDGFLNVAASFLEHLAHFASHIASELLLALYQYLTDSE